MPQLSQLFIPKAGQETRFEFDAIPTYLFRLHVPQSAGSTDTTHVDSPAFPDDMNKTHKLGSACGQDLLQFPPAEAASRLDAHLRWQCQHLRDSPCNLMSWSSSLLFLLHYGFHRQTKDYHPKPELSEIRLIMIDTRDFPKQTFLRDMDALNHYYGYNAYLGIVKKKWREQEYYFGEYLTQGHLDIRGRCAQMTMQQLVDGGLFTVICPALDKPNNNWADWAKPVCNLRVGIRESHAVDQKQIRSAIFMAQDCAGDRFLVPFALMLLGLRSRQSDNAAIANAFHSLFTDKELTFRNVKYDQSSHRMEELRRFQQLMEAVGKQHDDDASVIETARLIEGLGLSTNESNGNCLLADFPLLNLHGGADDDLALGEVNNKLKAEGIRDDGSPCMEELKRFQELMAMINNSSNDAAEKELQKEPIATISDSFLYETFDQRVAKCDL
ncbi:hypothetical protein FMUND_15028 [Fusarium mundagurra]|uniref:DUF7587 domain-containing protein n=1 Tax=Fusarium mundagurra TaxID=1567541 RepID=A0A8H5XSD6_9HYPO|nr:hypothetical protein FMUND_15028 [Fusarium mundagurra]